jgi:hypothetical protein
MPNFPHLNSQGQFPDVGGVDVYKYDNQFDYERFNATQMSLMICTVPWDVGEAHVGNRTISGIGNVVWFGSKAERDAWFDAIPDDKCYRFTTKFKELHREQVIDVPVPYDVASTYNYLVVRYNLFANDDSPVQYETQNGHREWFWFIREVEFVAPNTTRLHLLDDAFQTWMYDVTITNMVLERGHAPVFSTTVAQYLENPVENNQDLLTEDVNFGAEPSVVRHMDVLALNSGEVWACIATTANPQASWGTKAASTWNTPASAAYDQNGVPSAFVIACEPAQLDTLLANATASIPQFKQTVQGVFFAPKQLVSVAGNFTFAGVACHTLTSARTTLDLCNITKAAFGYDAKYAELAKLYTSPYAHIEITDEDGAVDVVKIEDTTGTLDVSASLSLAWPFINVDAHVLGTGGNAGATVTFRNITARTFNVTGTWYETLRSWKVPTFAVVLDAATEYDYSTHFDRAQRKVDYDTAYANSSASAAATLANAKDSATTAQANTNAAAATAQTNAKASASTAQSNANASAATAQTNTTLQANAAKANADASADTSVDNTALQVAANTAIISRSNQSALTDTSYVNGLAQANQAWEAGYTRDTTNNEVNAEYASAAIGAAGGAVNSAISGAASGGLIGAGIGLLTGAVSGAASMGQTAVAANLKSEQAELTVGYSQSKVNETSQNNRDRTTNQNSANSDNAATTNTASTGVTANLAATAKANATRTQTAATTAAANSYATETGNASRSYSTDTANAGRTYATETANAKRSYDTSVDNAQRSYDAAIANAGRTRTQAQSAIANDTAQAALRSPFVFGTFSNGDSATTKPMALFANIVTQSKSAIAAAGDEFLRYGYMYDRQWDFDGNWNIGKHFTYWKLKDFWVKDLQVPDMYMDKLRFFLFGGVTIWRRPEDIGHVSIYDNM